MTNFRSLLAGLLALGLAAPAARAQTADVAGLAVTRLAPTTDVGSAAEARVAPANDIGAAEPSSAAPRPGPTVEAAAVGVRRAPASSSTVAAASVAQQGQFGRAETYMIVGGAAFVAGLLIGDDAGTIVMVGGAVLGLYGLYLYLQSQ